MPPGGGVVVRRAHLTWVIPSCWRPCDRCRRKHRLRWSRSSFRMVMSPSPLLTVITPGSRLGESGKALPDVSQTWDWEGAEAAVASCRSSLLVTEMFGAGRTPQERWGAMSGVVASWRDSLTRSSSAGRRVSGWATLSCSPKVILMA